MWALAVVFIRRSGWELTTTNMAKSSPKKAAAKKAYVMNKEERDMEFYIRALLDEGKYPQAGRFAGSVAILGVEAKGSIFGTVYGSRYRWSLVERKYYEDDVDHVSRDGKTSSHELEIKDTNSEKFVKWLVVKDSGLGDGVGVYAARVFAPNQVIGFYVGNEVLEMPATHDAEVTREWAIVEGARGKMQKRFCPPYDGHLVTHPMFMGMHLMREHSSRLNANATARVADAYLDRIVNVQMLTNGMFVAKRNINPDEELFVDYGNIRFSPKPPTSPSFPSKRKQPPRSASSDKKPRAK